MAYAGQPDPRRPRRRLRRSIAIATVALSLLVIGSATAIWGYGRSLNGNIKRTDVFGNLPGGRPAATVGKAMNVLVLGSDSRDPGNTSSSRTDTIMLMHLDAQHKHGYVISIPRDTWVYVPPSADGKSGDAMAKINAAYAWGGTALTVQTVERFTGVRIDHVVLIDFAGFQQVVDALGGLDMTVDQTIKSIFPPYRTFTAGTRHFTGTEALDYIRQRYQFTDGDFARERHQQQFLTSLLDKAANSGTLGSPAKLNAFLQAATKSITVDKGFDLISTAFALHSLRSNDVTFLASPSTGTGWEGEQSVVYADTAKSQSLYQAVGSDAMARWLNGNSATPSPIPQLSPSPSDTPGG
jgi:LCP family protein required for cell wall assembly